MAIPIDIESAFTARCERSRNLALRPSTSKQRNLNLQKQNLEIRALAETIFVEFNLILSPSRERPSPLHPHLKVALLRDSFALARYLVTAESSEFRRLLDFKSILLLVKSSIAKLPPLPHYEGILKAKGCDHILARALAHLAILIAARSTARAKVWPEIIKVIRYLSKARLLNKTTKRKAAYLFNAHQQFSALAILDIDVEEEFVELLCDVLHDDTVDFARLRSLALDYTSKLSPRRGRIASSASVAHEFIMHQLQVAYTWDEENDDFIDELTAATRKEFFDPDFSPRAARRRVRNLTTA